MMRLSARGEALIKQFEQLRLTAYIPLHGDKWTIGWGHTGPEVHEGLVWTEEQAEQAFRHDVIGSEFAVIRATDVPLTQNQFDALVSFTFNVGADHEAHSTLCRLVNATAWPAAAAEFQKWDHCNGKEVPGLLNRRKAEQALFMREDV